MDILNMIRQLAVKGISKSELNSYGLSIEFEDGSKVAYKYDIGLYMWAVIHQHMRYERIKGNTDHCVDTSLKYYDLLGFCLGDAVLIQYEDGTEEPTLFSSP